MTMFESDNDKNFEKKLYRTKIIQSIFDSLAEIEQRVQRIERR